MGSDRAGSDRTGFLRRTLSRLTVTDDEREAEELREGCLDCGATLIADAPDRSRVDVSGTLRAVTLRPRAGVPALEAELYDGTGTLSIIWLGRRRIPGIQAGRGINAHGLISTDGGRRVMFNPRYSLTSAAE